jgi:hypothetical protein
MCFPFKEHFVGSMSGRHFHIHLVQGQCCDVAAGSILGRVAASPGRRFSLE